MFDAEILAMLRCPRDGKQLELADANFVAELNAGIERGSARDRRGQSVTRPIDGALLTSGGQFAYPIRGGIATLVADDAIVVDEGGGEPADAKPA